MCVVADVHLEPGQGEVGGDVEGGGQLLSGVLQSGLEVLLLETRGEPSPSEESGGGEGDEIFVELRV